MPYEFFDHTGDFGVRVRGGTLGDLFAEAAAALTATPVDPSTVLWRELHDCLGIGMRTRFLDLASILPALFPNTQNDSLDEWTRHFGLPPVGRHRAIADAYANAQFLLLALERGQRLGLATTADMLELEKSQRWLGRHR